MQRSSFPKMTKESVSEASREESSGSRMKQFLFQQNV